MSIDRIQEIQLDVEWQRKLRNVKLGKRIGKDETLSDELERQYKKLEEERDKRLK